jgi:hypothetical protein
MSGKQFPSYRKHTPPPTTSNEGRDPQYPFFSQTREIPFRYVSIHVIKDYLRAVKDQPASGGSVPFNQWLSNQRPQDYKRGVVALFRGTLDASLHADGMDFSKGNFTGVDFSYSDFSGVTLGAFANADLRACKFSEVTATGNVLDGADLRFSIITDCRWQNLEGVRDLRLGETVAERNDFTGFKFSHSQIHNGELRLHWDTCSRQGLGGDLEANETGDALLRASSTAYKEQMDWKAQLDEIKQKVERNDGEMKKVMEYANNANKAAALNRQYTWGVHFQQTNGDGKASEQRILVAKTVEQYTSQLAGLEDRMDMLEKGLAALQQSNVGNFSRGFFRNPARAVRQLGLLSSNIGSVSRSYVLNSSGASAAHGMWGRDGTDGKVLGTQLCLCFTRHNTKQDPVSASQALLGWQGRRVSTEQMRRR